MNAKRVVVLIKTKSIALESIKCEVVKKNGC